ncbi:hypothetical protein OIV83_004258 [Microbotryomycetes sp. JL201]|nr:hypothetical protein OIV83_004258 [Microbotryomycetes sp. JL201]
MAPSPAPVAQTATSHIMAIVLTHSTLAIGFTLASKAVLRVLKLSLASLWIQSLVSLVILLIVAKAYPAASISISKPLVVWRTFLPLGLTRILGALSKTACLANVDAAFYQTARGLLLPFTVILSLYFLPNTRFAPLTIAGITLVVVGFVFGIWVDLEKALSLNWGIALGVWSSFTTAVETVVLKQYSAGNDLHMLQLIYMSNALAAVVYAPLVYIFEAESWHAASLDKQHLFITNAVICAFVALALSFATWMQVKMTSPVTHTVVTATRGVVQSLLASVAFHEAMPFHRWVSTIFIIGGTGVYSYSKAQEKAQGTYAPLPTSSQDAGGMQMTGISMESNEKV